MHDYLEKIKKVPPGSIAILIAQVDPDAVGSAVGFRHLLEGLGWKVAVYYAGCVTHPQNKALLNRYDYGLLPVSEWDGSGECALVDSSRCDDSRFGKVIDPLFVIDHHRDSDVDGWIDMSVGSASTMVVELLEDFRNDVCLALALGIYTDTKGLVRACERDFAAYLRVRTDELIDLINYSVELESFVRLGSAASDAVFDRGSMLVGMGRVDGDELAMAADALLRVRGAVLVVTWGLVGESVRVCARSTDLTIPLGQKLAERFGSASGAKMLPDGCAEGGALLVLDRGWLTEDEFLEIVGRRLREWLF